VVEVGRVTAYYEDDACTIYHGDCRELLPTLTADVLVTDPPYGFDYTTGRPRAEGNARSIRNDHDVSIRSAVLDWWADRGPALVFGSWRVPKPAGTKGVLVWDKGGALGMGDLSMPWKFDHEDIYVLGSGFVGRRDCGSVLRHPPVQSVARAHPNEKPVGLMSALLAKCPPGTVLDPCMGVGSVLRAAKARGRHSIGIEIEERYCEVAAKRLAQEVLDFGGVA
jgi:DNA modification methylase